MSPAREKSLIISLADPDCHNQMFNGGDYEIGWLGEAGNNDKLSSIFCTQGA